jgi:hypothetical protein
MGVGPVGATLAGALATVAGPPAAMAVGAGLSAAILVGVRLLSPAAFTLDPDEYAT